MKQKSGWALYGAAFAIPVALYLLVMALCRIVPFGDQTLMIWDGNGQYAAFLAAWRRVLLGQEDALYTFSRVLGSDMTGLISYYLASPLNVLLVFFAEDQLPLAYSALVLLKIGLCGLCAMGYLRGAHGVGFCGLLFSTAYALMGYTAVYGWCVMWMDGVLLLPLMALGIRRIMAGRGPFLYVLALAAALWSNYYIGYILCAFAVLYGLYLALMRGMREGFERGELRRALIRFGAGSLLAGGLAAGLLWPTYEALQGGYQLFDWSALSFTRMASALDVATKLFTGAVDYEQLRYGLPNLYIGIPALALAGVYMLSPKIPRKQRLLSAALLGTLLASFLVRAPYLIWHGMDAPNALPARFSFLFSFVLLDLGCQGFGVLRRADRQGMGRRLAWLGVGFLGMTCVLFRAELPPYLAYETVCMDVLCFLAACGLCALLPESGRRAPVGALCALQAICLITNGYLSIHRLAATEALDQVTVSGYRAQSSEITEPLATLRQADNGLYRLEKNFIRSENDALAYGYAGLSHYSSDIDESFLRFGEKLGLYHSYYRLLYGAGNTPVLESVLGVKYLLWKENGSIGAPPAEYRALWSQAGVTVYENPYALPFAFAVPRTQTADPMASDDPFINQNALLMDLSGTRLAAFTPVQGFEVTRKEDWLEMTLPVEAGQRVYLRAPGTHFTINGGDLENAQRFEGCIALPVSGENAVYDIHAYQGEADEATAYAGVLHMERLSGTLLPMQACEVESDTDSHLRITVDAQENAQLLVTLPYDAGWTALLDGQPCETTARYGALLAVNLPQGRHVVELRFVPCGLAAGLCISGVSVLALLLWAGVRAKRAGHGKPRRHSRALSSGNSRTLSSSMKAGV
ncbi:MAG: YfhO family protein [Clostridia bacterium]